MSELVLDKSLQESKPGDAVRAMARARTLTVLRSLDEPRKAQVVRFLYQAGLIGGVESDLKAQYELSISIWEGKTPRVIEFIISLRMADLSGIDLHAADLSGIHLTAADLMEANLSRVELCGANLFAADLRHANLRALVYLLPT